MMLFNNKMYNIFIEGGDLQKIKINLNLKECLKRCF